MNAFPVKITSERTIGQLKRMIRKERPDSTQVPAAHLGVYCMSVDGRDDDALEEFHEQINRGQRGSPPLTVDTILETFPPPNPRHIHVLIAIPSKI